MKHTYLASIYLILFFVLVGCKKKKDDETVPQVTTTVEQDKQNIKNTFSDLNGCITQIRDAEGTKAVTDFVNLDNGDALSRDWVVGLIDSLVKQLDLQDVEDNKKFNFNANTGTYTWDINTEDYVKINTPSDKIVIKFPSKESQTTNNAVLTISKYVDEDVIIDGETFWLPKSVEANLLVDGVEVFKVNASASYDDPIPINVNLAVVLKPFTYSIVGNRVNDKQFNATLSVSNGSGCTTKASLDFEFTHSDYPTIDLDTDVKSLLLTVEHNSLKIVSSVDMQSLNAIEDPTIEQINTYVKTNVYYNGQKIGELVTYDEAAEDDMKVRIIYKDGSSEDTEVYYKPFLEDLKAILSPKFGEVDI